MAEKQNKEKLFTGFPPVPTTAWEDQIKIDLKGADYEKRLVWKTLEGIKVKPYYREESLKGLEYLQVHPDEFPYVRGTKTNTNEWLVRQDIVVENCEKANAKALKAIQGGASAIGFILADTAITSCHNLEILLKGIDLKSTAINFIIKNRVIELLDELSEYTQSEGLDAKTTKIALEFDPIGSLILTGVFLKSETDDFETIQQAISKKQNGLPVSRVVSVDAKIFGNSGSSAVQELAFGLSAANEYLVRLTDRNIRVDDVASSIQFNFSVGSNYFMEIAKIRAARILWATIVASYKPESLECSSMFVHSETSKWNKTTYDAYVNMLRSTTESMSAVIGGVNSLTVNPFDSTYSKSNDFSERIARNTQIIIKEESYLHKVVDPAAGSYYIESLTDSIAVEAWKLFLETEQKGGFIAAFKSGFIQSQVAESARIRDLNIATRREILLGTNQYPNFSELNKSGLKPEDLQTKLKNVSNAVAEPLTPYRGALAFEILRLKTDALGKRPKVFMLTVGNVTIRKARAAFACNFFACAGYEVIDNAGFDTVEAGVKEALKCKSDILVICSSDEEYPEVAPRAFKMIHHKALVVVAGAPECMELLKSAGIEHFIHVKSNVLESLEGFNKLLGIL